ncbi:MAG: hypothetical protein VST65_03740 [Nitrospirota bacterium]|nr:hypothetical protein [Nitrospirota bacterium]
MPRRVERTFPDVLAIGVPSGITIAQSRLTFTGQRGLVLIGWGVLLTVSNSLTRLFTGVQIVGTARLDTPFPGAATGELQNNGDEYLAWSWTSVLDPPEGSFLELQTRQNTSVVIIPANGSRLLAVSFGDVVGEGPTVTPS